jgi:hypothetical protein
MDEMFALWLVSRREYAKPKSCRKRLVGPMRRWLARHTAAGIIEDFPDLPPKAAQLIKARATADAELSEFCTRCGRCKWSRDR